MTKISLLLNFASVLASSPPNFQMSSELASHTQPSLEDRLSLSKIEHKVFVSRAADFMIINFKPGSLLLV